jgi:hypothetical protein
MHILLKRVIIVEESESRAEMLRIAPESIPQIETRIMHSAREAIAAARESQGWFRRVS